MHLIKNGQSYEGDSSEEDVVGNASNYRENDESDNSDEYTSTSGSYDSTDSSLANIPVQQIRVTLDPRTLQVTLSHQSSGDAQSRVDEQGRLAFTINAPAVAVQRTFNEERNILDRAENFFTETLRLADIPIELPETVDTCTCTCIPGEHCSTAEQLYQFRDLPTKDDTVETPEKDNNLESMCTICLENFEQTSEIR